MMNSKKLLYVLIGLVIIVGAVVFAPLFFHGETSGIENSGGSEQGNIVDSEDVTINILCVGDVMGHMSQITAAQRSDGSYDFNENFQYVKEYVEAADIAICNVETTFGGAPYTGYPSFSSPDELSEALARAGFNVAVTANNHMVDRGSRGLLRTIEVLKGDGFVVSGSRPDENSPRYAMVNVKGVDVAIVAYTYETPSQGSSGVYINSCLLSNETAALINSFSYETLEEDLGKVKATVDAARAEGADIVVLYYHWGEEYQLSANPAQREVARITAETIDADVIFGSHPHNLQEAEYIGEIPVFFSMGNFISNQRVETLGSDKKHTETGVIAKVKIDYNKTEGKISEVPEMGAIPTWVDRYSHGGRTVYAVVPLDEELEANESLAVSGHLIRAKNAWEDANELLGID